MGLEMRQYCATQKHRPKQIYFDRLDPRVPVHVLDESIWTIHSRVVNEDVYLRKACERNIHQFIDIFRSRNIRNLGGNDLLSTCTLPQLVLRLAQGRRLSSAEADT